LRIRHATVSLLLLGLLGLAIAAVAKVREEIGIWHTSDSLTFFALAFPVLIVSWGVLLWPKSQYMLSPSSSMSSEIEPIRLQYDLSIRFTCGNYTEEKVILCACPLPTTTEGMFFKHKNLVRSNPYEILLIYGSRILGSQSDELPIDWRDPADLASAAYDKLDKGVLGRVPLIGPILESALPDARWRHALWYHIVIDEAGRCDYKLHLGPEKNINVRNKCEGTCQL
jgi:hypothetical protein